VAVAAGAAGSRTDAVGDVGDAENRRLFDELARLVTESVNERFVALDELPTRAILEAINAEDARVAEAVRHEIPAIEAAVGLVVETLGRGGRLIYVGAGTSGRLGVLDAAECPPTFGSDPERIVGVIAGGPDALIRAVEGAEDRGDEARASLARLTLTASDCVAAIAASSRTPYALEALAYAREIGASTIFITCNPVAAGPAPGEPVADVVVRPVTGPEVLAGSTRMKAGTATKLVLNMITTASMVRLGKVYGNLMVDLMSTSRKLEERSKRVVMMVTGVDYQRASEVLEAAGGHVKTALVMELLGVDRTAAAARLAAADGFVRSAIGGGGRGVG